VKHQANGDSGGLPAFDSSRGKIEFVAKQVPLAGAIALARPMPK
jgi:hypothetical protein